MLRVSPHAAWSSSSRLDNAWFYFRVCLCHGGHVHLWLNKGSFKEILYHHPGPQMSYQVAFCLWLLSFEQNIAEQVNKYAEHYIPLPQHLYMIKEIRCHTHSSWCSTGCRQGKSNSCRHRYLPRLFILLTCQLSLTLDNNRTWWQRRLLLIYQLCWCVSYFHLSKICVRVNGQTRIF